MSYCVNHSFDDRFSKKLNYIAREFGSELLDIDGIGEKSLDVVSFAERFLERQENIVDVTVDGNGNMDNNTALSFEMEQSKGLHRLFGYYSIWSQLANDDRFGIKCANRMLENCVAGPLKIHDLHFSQKSYCYNFSLYELVFRGLPFVKRVQVGPPKYLSSYINLVIQFIAYASNQLAGAVSLGDFFVYMDYFARKDYGEDYLDHVHIRKVIEQNLQSLVWSMNFEFRACQCAFTNLSLFDEYFLRDLFDTTVYPDNSFANYQSIMRLQEFYMRWYAGVSKQQTLTFPVNTACFYRNDNNEIVDQKFLDVVSAINAHNGMFNIYCGPLGKLSTCCRLISNTGDVVYQNSLGGGGISIGSHRVVTLNLAHIAYKAEDKDEFFKLLEKYAASAQDILTAHYDILQKNIRNKKLPLYFYNFMYLDKQFSTTGFIALNEACEILGEDITTEAGQALATRILNTLNDVNVGMTKKDGRLRNLEQTPGETAAVMFAKKDRLLFKATARPYKLYSNQYIPLWKHVDIQDRIKLQGLYDSSTSGGAICHLNVSESLTKDQMKRLITHAAAAGCIYFAVNCNLCRCKTCNTLYVAKIEKSPCHNAPVTNFMRIVGFLVPVEAWIAERREEYTRRQFYDTEAV